jgi:hypothetical protein
VAFNHPRNVRVAGVTRKGGIGLPNTVIQEEKTGCEQVQQVRGTVKAAVLKGDPDCPNLVAVSVYNTKPVHFLSMNCQSIQWIVKEHSIWCADTNTREVL